VAPVASIPKVATAATASRRPVTPKFCSTAVVQHTGQPGRTAAGGVAQWPRVRGVSRSSQAPASTVARAPRERTTLVLPMPGLPGDSTTEPEPVAARRSAGLQDLELLVALEQAGGHRATMNV
jgi:hypothetical protein